MCINFEEAGICPLQPGESQYPPCHHARVHPTTRLSGPRSQVSARRSSPIPLRHGDVDSGNIGSCLLHVTITFSSIQGHSDRVARRHLSSHKQVLCSAHGRPPPAHLKDFKHRRFLRKAVVPTWRRAYVKTIVQECFNLLSVEKEKK